MNNKDLKKRILTISYRNFLSHLGSCLTAVDIIDDIYARKEASEKFILSSGHAGLALYVVLEKYGGRDAEAIFHHHGVHPDRCTDCNIHCSTGSLGIGLAIACGMALANPLKKVYCLISDGECTEGIVWETANIIRKYQVRNLEVHLNYNGWGAYDRALAIPRLGQLELVTHLHLTENEFSFLEGQDAHYHTLTQAEYKAAMRRLD
jgi:transketolase